MWRHLLLMCLNAGRPDPECSENVWRDSCLFPLTVQYASGCMIFSMVLWWIHILFVHFSQQMWDWTCLEECSAFTALREERCQNLHSAWGSCESLRASALHSWSLFCFSPFLSQARMYLKCTLFWHTDLIFIACKFLSMRAMLKNKIQLSCFQKQMETECHLCLI